MWEAMTLQAARHHHAGRGLHRPNQYGEPTPITRALIEDGRTSLLLNAPIALDCPVRLLHGQDDPTCPGKLALRIAERITSHDVQVILVKDGDHRLSRPQDLAAAMPDARPLSSARMARSPSR